MSDDVFSQMAAALNGHGVTDAEGEITGEGETPVSEPAAEDQITPETESAQETPAESEETVPTEETETEQQIAEDESGKKYVPKERFDKVWARMREAERKATENTKTPGQSVAPHNAPIEYPQTPVNKTDALEVEILKGKYPQFDPESKSYSPVLDQLGAEVFAANPGLTRIQAAQEAMRLAQGLTSEVSGVRAEARTVKAEQSDRGITTRVTSSRSTAPNVDEMSTAEMEVYLKKNGQW